MCGGSSNGSSNPFDFDFGGTSSPCECECDGGELAGDLGFDLPTTTEDLDLPISGAGDLDLTFVGVIYSLTGNSFCIPKMLSGLALQTGRFTCDTECNQSSNP